MRLHCLGVLGLAASLCAQAPIPLPSFGSTYADPTGTRGFYFQAPVDLTVTGLRVPDEANAGVQCVELLRLAGQPPAWPASTTGGQQLYRNNVPSNQVIPCSVFFAAGEWVGVLGACGTATMNNSYAATTGPFATEILGRPVTLRRFLTQTNLHSSGGNQAYSAEDAFTVSRVEVYCVPGPGPLPLPAFGSTYSSSSLTRGYYFRTPVAITITGLRVPDEASAGVQCVEVSRLASAPPAYPATASGGQVFYANNVPSGTVVKCNLSFAAGEWIGVLGACGTTTMNNSYATVSGPFQSEILGQPVTLTRFITQTNLHSTGGNQPYSGATGQISRVELFYVADINPIPLASFGSTFSSTSATRGFWFQTPAPILLTGLRVPDEYGAGVQCVEVSRLAGAPPAYPGTASGGQVFYANSVPSSQVIPCALPFQAGEFIGVLGACGTSTMRNSYGTPIGPFSSTIAGQPVTLTRFLTQTNLHSTGGNQPYSNESTGNISRVEVDYIPGLPLSAFTSTYTYASHTRGFYFQTPADIVILGLRVPDESNAGVQCVEVSKLAGVPPAAGASGGQVFYANNVPSSQVIPCSLHFNAGDWIGILGACGTTTMYNSYGSGPFTSSIGGVPVTLTRLLTQTNLHTTGGNQLYLPSTGSIGRVEVYYVLATHYAEFITYGRGCGLPLLLDSNDAPILGQTFDAEVRQIPSGTGFGFLLIGLRQLSPGIDLTPVGMPGCLQYSTADALLGFGVAGPTAVVPVAVPNLPPLIGASFYSQAATFSAGFTPLGVISSNGGRLHLDVYDEDTPVAGPSGDSGMRRGRHRPRRRRCLRTAATGAIPRQQRGSDIVRLPAMTCRLPAACVLSLLLAPLCAQNFVRVRDGAVEPRPGVPSAAPELTAVTAALCGTVLGARDGQPIANAAGSTVTTNAFMNPACINRRGQLAFVGAASGARNQGIFVADQNGVRAIAMGCGQGGGSGQHGSCGDPSPAGGTFAGFFTGTVFAPPINDAGDVLFLADLVNASVPRGLFLYVAGTQTIVKVAGVGEPSPLGGVLTALGPGALDRDRHVLFLAQSTTSSRYLADILQWDNGALSVFAANGMAAPGGATVAMLGTESFGFADNTTVFAGPVPSINDCGQVAYRIITTGGPVGRGIAVRQNGVDAWYLTDAMATPNGGSWFDFQAAAINGSGQIAVFSDYRLNGAPTSGWFVGRPGSWRHALSFNDPVDGGQCHGLAFSRSPMTPLSDDGDVVVWCDLNPNGNMGRIVVCASDGSITVLARQGSPTGAGGSYGSIDAWPSMNSSGRVSVSAGTPGAGWTSAHLLAVLCGPAVASSPCVSLGDSIRIDDFGPAGQSFLLCASFGAQTVPAAPYGTLLIGPSIAVLLGPTPYPGLSGPHTLALPVPNLPALNGLTLHLQSLALASAGVQLTNRASTQLR